MAFKPNYEAPSYDAIVLGLGGMGSAVLYHLARRGLKVLGIEQHHVAHDRGSSHGHVRAIRKAYFEHPDYVPLLERAYTLWDELQDETGVELFVRSGLFLSGKPSSESMEGLASCYRAHDLPHERMSSADARKRFPLFTVPEDYVVYYDPEGGYLFCERCIEAHLDRAEELGAEVRIHEAATAWRANDQGVIVTTEKGEVSAGKLILTMGAWTAEILRELDIDLEVVRKVQLWYDAGVRADLVAGEMLPFFVEHDNGVFYGFPSIEGEGLKIAEHTGGEGIEDPAEPNRSLEVGDETEVLRFLADFIPTLDAKLIRHSVCMYTNTPDRHFILDRHPNHSNVVLGAGFSGHGFKFACVVGEILADLAMNGKTDLPVGFLGLQRLLALH